MKLYSVLTAWKTWFIKDLIYQQLFEFINFIIFYCCLMNLQRWQLLIWNEHLRSWTFLMFQAKFKAEKTSPLAFVRLRPNWKKVFGAFWNFCECEKNWFWNISFYFMFLQKRFFFSILIWRCQWEIITGPWSAMHLNSS